MITRLKIEFSCLYIPQGLCNYEVQMNMYFIYFLSESPPLIQELSLIPSV